MAAADAAPAPKAEGDYPDYDTDLREARGCVLRRRPARSRAELCPIVLVARRATRSQAARHPACAPPAAAQPL